MNTTERQNWKLQIANGNATQEQYEAAERTATEPTPVLVGGEMHLRCSVCERVVVRNRSELDDSGRCQDCQP